jgi:hypothetical protein
MAVATEGRNWLLTKMVVVSVRRSDFSTAMCGIVQVLLFGFFLSSCFDFRLG